MPQLLVSDNAPEFHDDMLCTWLHRIGCKPPKTPLYHPQSNGPTERMVSTVKMGLKAFIKGRSSFESCLSRLLFSYRSIPHAGKTVSPSAMMGRQIRSPITMSFNTAETLWYFGKDSKIPVEA